MTTEVRLFTPLGVPLADINVAPVASHIINDVGDASFTISVEDYNAQEKNIQFGNILLINHDQLPSWIGFIDPIAGREWGAGEITIHALSAERIFEERIVFPEKMQGTNGAILKRLLSNMLTSSDGGIKVYPGDIYMGGPNNVYPYLGRAREVMDRLAKKGKCDWSITHELVQGRIRLYANLYHGERGETKERVLDARNTKLASPIYTEEGEIWNHVVFMKALSSAGEIRISKAWRDEDSIGRYGLKMYLGEANTDDETALDWQARAWLYDHAYPRGITMPDIVNYDDTFADIALGNKYRWENHGIEFSDWLINSGDLVRLTGFEVDYGAASVAATVESTRKPFDIWELFNA